MLLGDAVAGLLPHIELTEFDTAVIAPHMPPPTAAGCAVGSGA